ncbi:YkvI family membrane protein [Bacillus fonticola]|uniref:YkvI family membrane protein n=1 Tax=Bacillus fonticola TaxID=2728853 RepID=UPI001475D426|nr:GerAB/ArcD/ProY family transporter [Bacillus fonticola]
MRGKWGQSLQLAFVYVGTVVGAGFATGKEIVEFFTRFGFYGLLGIVLSGYLFMVFGTKLMELAIETKSKSYQELNQVLFGKLFGSGINIVMMMILFGVNAVMLSGAGAVFEEQLGYPKMLGVFITIFLAILILLIGSKGLFLVNTFVVPMMVIFSFVMLYLAIQLPQFTEMALFVPVAEDGWKAFLTPFSYAAFNLSLAQAVLVPVAYEIDDRDVIRWGGRIGGLLLGLILMSSHLTLSLLENVTLYEIPMAVMMKQLASGLYWIFILIIYGEIFTSVIGNTFGLERQLSELVSWSSSMKITVIFGATYVVSLVDYSTLLSALYPIFGYVGLLFLFLLWLRPLEGTNQNVKK